MKYVTLLSDIKILKRSFIPFFSLSYNFKAASILYLKHYKLMQIITSDIVNHQSTTFHHQMSWLSQSIERKICQHGVYLLGICPWVTYFISNLYNKKWQVAHKMVTRFDNISLCLAIGLICNIFMTNKTCSLEHNYKVFMPILSFHLFFW